MSTPIIRVQGLWKEYQVGGTIGAAKTFREMVTDAIASPLQTLRGAVQSPPQETFWALKDVSFDVQAGEVVGIIGRNGAGKSTLLKILSRITAPTKGQIEIRGRIASLLEVGTGFHPELTGRENVYLNGAILGMARSEIRRKFDEIVDFSGVEKFIDTPVKRYSSGMQMRLAFAVAAHLEPEILVIDEVLAVGDADFQKKCLGKMGEVAKGGRTVLFVSHNLAAVQNLCSRGILLEFGAIACINSSEDVINQYHARHNFNKRDEAILGASIGAGVAVEQITLSEPLPRANEPMSITVHVNSELDCKLNALSLVLFNASGQRITVLDFRETCRMPMTLSKGTTSFSAHLPRLPLIEGDYTLDIYADTHSGPIHLRNLFDFRLRPRLPINEVLPYPAEARGLMDLPFVGAISVNSSQPKAVAQ